MKKQLLNALKVVMLLLIPTLNFAQAPPLGTAADFVLFTSVGAVTNVGTYKYLTHLTGNVGTNSGSSTNFGNVNGVMHDNDGASLQCAADLLIAYNSLDAAIPDSNVGLLIGNGDTIKAGTYLMPGASSLNLGLTLNAEGDPNAVFIFKMPTTVAYAFTANPNSKIHLINGAQACNVFWLISGAMNMGAGATMRGTIVAGGAITMSATDTLEGRALTINGAITVSNGAIGFLAYTPIGCGSPILNGPTAPTFVATASYAVFATTGAATDCGTSHIVGDVGGNTIAPTGFNPDSVTGGIYFNDPSTNAAAADLLLVYNYLLALPYDIKLLDPAEFGHNLVLTPHTYQMDAAVTLTDTLYLNAMGNADAVFVIKTFGAFATTVGSKIILMNGTQAKNVYWFCSAAVSITANSMFKGAIIAHDAIEMLPGAHLDGRVFSTHGALTLCGITAALPSPISSGPSDQTACAGDSVSFSVTASGTALTYQWRKGTVNLVNGGNISGVTNDTLTFNPVNISDAALNYNVIVSGPSQPAYTSSDASLTVNPLPVPTITGNASACVGIAGNVYTTETGMTNYVWTVSAGGTITAGGTSTSSTVTVTWNTAGAQTVTVNYANGNGCTATTATVKNVTVNALPVPTITGNNSACIGVAGNVYTTEAGMTNYVWTVSTGGTITAGGTSTNNTVTVTWNTLGGQTVTVNYVNGNGCTATTATVKNVTVNALPVPTITGSGSVCAQTAGNIYSTEAGMTGYIWNVSAGGTITAGTGTNQITVTWNTVGAQSVTVNYTNANGCTAASATVYNVTVNALPTPTITGPASVCVNSTGNVYTTQAGMTNYVWTVSAGGTITAGGTSTSSTVTVTWNTTGAQTVTVNYVNGNGCTATTATVKNVTVNALPIPTITGNNSACIGVAGNVYTTEAGMTNYVWTVSAGGTITAGGTSTNNTVTVTWNTAGTQTVTVNYVNGNGCTATTATVKNVTVNALPVPTITGSGSVCAQTAGNIYSTEAGMTGYIWNVSAGGTITAGTGTNQITVTWNTAGAQSVTVNYTNANGCTAASATVYNVTVNALPTPTITGPASVCVNSTGNVYTTQTVMTNYVWTVSAGGTITAGGTSTSNTVTVTWNMAGAQTVSVNYTNANGCQAASPTVYNVTVNPLPVPTITGPASICAGTTGNVYTTQTGMTNYIWAVSAGGTITAGGTTTSNTVTVTWSTAGAQTVSVIYTNVNGCTSNPTVVYTVTVNPLPSPTINGTYDPCMGQTEHYYTESGMTNYQWTVTPGGTILSGHGTFHIQVQWTVLGVQTLGINYTNSGGCSLPAPYTQQIFVYPLPGPAGSITGTSPVCAGATGVVYSTTPITDATSYTWTVPPGATIAGGAGTISITVNFGANAASGNITVAGTNDCGNGTPSTFAVTVNPLPAAAGTITGAATVCQGDMGVSYSVPTIAYATGYVWTLPPEATIATGANTKDITVNFSNSASSGMVTVHGTNACGSGENSPDFSVTVNTKPPAPVITLDGVILTSNAPLGNQWYFNGTAIPGATAQTYEATASGDYYVIVTLNNCSSDPSNTLTVIMTGFTAPAGIGLKIYPVPNDGLFNVSCTWINDEILTLEVYSFLGVRIYESKILPVQGNVDQVIDLRPVPTGIYTVVLKTGDDRVVRRILVNK